MTPLNLTPERIRYAVLRGAQAAVEGGLFHIGKPYIEQALSTWTPEMVRETIRADKDVLAGIDLSKVKAQVQVYAPVITHLSLETVAQWLYIIRPDLWEVVSKETGGERWVMRQLSTLAQKLFM